MANERKRLKTGLLALVVGLGALVALQGVLRQLLEGYFLPTRGARWIWVEEGGEEGMPVAFYAVRDFELTEVPGEAILTMAADEEALVFLNAVPIGGGRYVNGRSLKSYNVVEALRVGTNRLVVEGRSVRGIGGLLLHLETGAAEGGTQVVTDDSWRIFRESHEELHDVDRVLPAGEVPRVWGPSSVGRWMVSGSPRRIPTIADLRTTKGRLEAQRFRLPAEQRRWQSLGRTDRSSPALGHWVTFDFGQNLSGYLALRFPAQVGEASQPIGLLYLGNQPRILNQAQAERHVVTMPGQRIWLDARPRRFRYATYVGLTPVSGADVYPVDGVLFDEIWATSRTAAGPFGLPVGQLGPTLEDVVWRELHSLPSLADVE